MLNPPGLSGEPLMPFHRENPRSGGSAVRIPNRIPDYLLIELCTRSSSCVILTVVYIFVISSIT